MLLSTASAHAATLSAFPPPQLLPGGTGSLNPSSQFGFPGLFWVITFAEWETTGDVSIQATVSSPANDPGTPVTHAVFMTFGNSTGEEWDRFELEVAGPATFVDSISAPVTLNVAGNAPSVTPNKIEYTGLVLPSGGFTPTLTFGLDVTPPVADEPLVLTLRPVAVIPEPGAGLLVMGGLALAAGRTRRRH